MFFAALLTIVKIWTQPKYPSLDEWIKKVCHIYMYIQAYVCIYTHNGMFAIKKNEILPFATTWMELQGIMLSEISQKKVNTI